ncbi:MAG: DUF1540 domain-containing protein [Bacillota bacterium]|nr:DUF1540 domain-containing protein [Bacillota bacterium]
MNGRLSCSAVNCVHNMSGLCSANRILVNGMSAHSSSGTQCETFAEKGLKNAITHFTNINISGEIRQLMDRDGIHMYPEVGCNAVSCRYNDDRKCQADGLMIMGAHAETSDGTYCETFVL